MDLIEQISNIIDVQPQVALGIFLGSLMIYNDACEAKGLEPLAPYEGISQMPKDIRSKLLSAYISYTVKTSRVDLTWCD
jgi:hypothetical protein